VDLGLIAQKGIIWRYISWFDVTINAAMLFLLSETYKKRLHFFASYSTQSNYIAA
jgi:hypothetical protein